METVTISLEKYHYLLNIKDTFKQLCDSADKLYLIKEDEYKPFETVYILTKEEAIIYLKNEIIALKKRMVELYETPAKPWYKRLFK